MCLSSGVKQQAPLPAPPPVAPAPEPTKLILASRKQAVNRRKAGARPTNAPPPAGGGLSIQPGGGQRS
jgi:hypothetical protein